MRKEKLFFVSSIVFLSLAIVWFSISMYFVTGYVTHSYMADKSSDWWSSAEKYNVCETVYLDDGLIEQATFCGWEVKGNDCRDVDSYFDRLRCYKSTVKIGSDEVGK